MKPFDPCPGYLKRKGQPSAMPAESSGDSNFCVPDSLCNGHILVEAYALSLHPCPLTSDEHSDNRRVQSLALKLCCDLCCCQKLLLTLLQGLCSTMYAKHCRVLSWTMALAPWNSNAVNHEQKTQEPRTTWWSLDFLRQKLSPASSEGLGRTCHLGQFSKRATKRGCKPVWQPHQFPPHKALRLWQFCRYCPGHRSDCENAKIVSWIKIIITTVTTK